MANARSQQAFLGGIDGLQIVKLFDLMPDVSFFLKDRRGRFVALNRRGCEFCGVRTEREALGKTDRDFFPRRRADEYLRDDRTVMRSGQAIVNRVESGPEAEGSPRLVMTSKIPLRDSRGRIVGLAGFSRLADQVREHSGIIEGFSKVMAYLHGHSQEAIRSRDLSELSGLSVSQFDRTFRKCFGTSPRQYLVRVRVEAACRKLARINQTITSIALETGFHDHAHFTRSFRAVMGLTPSQFRRELQSPTTRR